MQKRLLVYGGDLRSQYIEKYFCNKGYIVESFGLTKEEKEPFGGGEYDIAVLGLPAVKDGFVNCPNSQIKLSFKDFVSSLKGVWCIAGGRFGNEEISLAQSMGIKIFDYSEDEIFMTENALYTAEGTIAELVLNTKASVNGMKILITGYGRIAKALCNLLSVWPCDITVYARRESQRAICETRKIKTVSNVLDLTSYDCIINTIPADVFEKKALSGVKKDSVVIDLSQRPGYVNKELCKSLGINLLYLPGIPLKSAPQSAGIAAAKAVERFTEGN